MIQIAEDLKEGSLLFQARKMETKKISSGFACPALVFRLYIVLHYLVCASSHTSSVVEIKVQFLANFVLFSRIKTTKMLSPTTFIAFMAILTPVLGHARVTVPKPRGVCSFFIMTFSPMYDR
jgi:hypothetical protein